MRNIRLHQSGGGSPLSSVMLSFMLKLELVGEGKSVGQLTKSGNRILLLWILPLEGELSERQDVTEDG